MRGPKKRLSEEEVLQAIKGHLDRKGWGRLIEYNEGHKHGVDLRVRNERYPRDWFVEVKGEPSRGAKQNREALRQKYFEIALGQIVTRMESRSQYNYGIGFPASFRNVVSRLPLNACRKLRLHVFFVSPGHVESYHWKNWKKLKEETSRKDLS